MDKLKEIWSNQKWRWAIIGGAAGVLALAVLLIVLLAGGGEKLDGCTISVKSEIGVPMVDIGVYIYADEAKTDLLSVARTDENGTAVFSDAVPVGSLATLSGVADGYAVEEEYPVTQAQTEIVLEIVLCKKMSAIAPGSIMFDFTVTDTDGKEHTLSKLLEEKDAVVLNFWFAGCGPCQAEFPALQRAYETHGDKIALLALNPTEETEETIAAFKSQYGLTFPMAKCDTAMGQMIAGTTYPTTVVIDRYGIVSLVHVGSIVADGVFEGVFTHFASDAYTHEVVSDIMSLKIEVEPAPTIDPESGLMEVSGADGFEVTVAPGEKVECDVYKVSGMVLKLEDAAATVTYNEKEYTPTEGLLEVEVIAQDDAKPVRVAIGNTSEEEKTFRVSFYYREGSVGKPVAAVLGTQAVALEEGNVQGMYFSYKMEEDGKLVVECTQEPTAKYDFSLTNKRTNKTVIYSEAGLISEETKKPTLEIAVSSGDQVVLNVYTLEDSTGTHPAAKLSFLTYMGQEASEETTADTTPETTGGDTEAQVDNSSYIRIAEDKLLVSGKYVVVADEEYAMAGFDKDAVLAQEPDIKEQKVTSSKGAVWELIRDGKKVNFKNTAGQYLAPKGGNNDGVVLSANAYGWEVVAERGGFRFVGVDKDTVTLVSDETKDYRFTACKNETLTGENAGDYHSCFYLFRLDDGKFKSELKGTTEGVLSNPDTPVEIGGKLSFDTVDIGMNEMVLYHVYRVGRTTLSIKNENAYVVYNGRTYTPNGSGYIYISIPDDYPNVPAIMQIGNSGVDFESFEVNFYYPAGSYENPHDYKLGETVTTEIKAGNDQGVFYSWKASSAGTLTLEFAETQNDVVYGITITTQGTIPMQENVYSNEGTSVSIQLEANEKVEITIFTLPVNGRYPKATIKTIGKFE